MRLYEFADNKTYNPAIADLARSDVFQRTWPTDDLASALRFRRLQRSLRWDAQRARRSLQRRDLIRSR